MISELFISKIDLPKWLEGLSQDYGVFVPVRKKNHRFFMKFTPELEDFVIGEVRSFEPVKAFFARARERVAEGFKNTTPQEAEKPYAIVGVKACDLKGFKIQDFVFGDHGCPDPLYVKNRERNLIVGADCTCAIETCYCLCLGVKPYPDQGFDINLSEVNDGYVVQVGSDKGNAAIQKTKHLFREASKAVLEERDKKRKNVTNQVQENVRALDIPEESRFSGIIERNYDSEIWNDEAKNCVECGACTIICPTCHCFLLYDQKSENQMERLRVWDSCMIKDYARVAGGANPRPKLFMRLRNRFEKKFDFFPKVAKVYACTGCGRCVSACPAKIDIRRVLKRLVTSLPNG